MRFAARLRALVPLAAYLIVSTAVAQDQVTDIAPNANDIALGAPADEPVLPVPDGWITVSRRSKRARRDDSSRNDLHHLTKRHYGVFTYVAACSRMQLASRH